MPGRKEQGLQEAFQVVAKPRGAVCNLSCEYCFYLHKKALYPNGTFRMSDELLEEFVRQFIEVRGDSADITFDWQGGEPTLMGLDFFRLVVELQEKYRRPGMLIRNTLQTNATTLDGEWCRFLHENRFLVGVSLDGPRDVHDAYRKDQQGVPTFERVMDGLDLLRKHLVEFNVLACVHAAGAGRGLEVYRFLRDTARARMIQFIPVVEREGDSASPFSIRGEQYGDFLVDVFDEWVRRDVGRVFVQLFDVTLGVWSGYPSSLCVFSETCGNAPAMEHNGDLFCCDHFVAPEHRLGTLSDAPLAELASSDVLRKFGRDKHETLPRQCRECDVRFVCNGGCPKNRFAVSSDGEEGLNYLCEGYRAFFTHVAAPMTTMTRLLRQHRSPAEIMLPADS